jgi:hypothetical protein
MRPTKLLVLSALVMAYSGSASAGTITDPAMGMDAGSFSTALSLFTGFTPSQTTGGGFLDLFNDTGEVITSITFQVTVKPGLVDLIDREFICNGAGDSLPNPFFLTCALAYDNSTGQLDFVFSGVSPAGPDQGIPPLAPGCTSANADTDPCAGQGHFALIFNNGFSLTGDTGGWIASEDSPFNAPPVITLADLTTVPEPGTLPMAFTALLSLSVIAARRRRRNRPMPLT